MEEQELQNLNNSTFRDENSDAWLLKGPTRAAEARAFFGGIISWAKAKFARSVNGQTPDANGNINIAIPQGFSGSYEDLSNVPQTFAPTVASILEVQTGTEPAKAVTPYTLREASKGKVLFAQPFTASYLTSGPHYAPAMTLTKVQKAGSLTQIQYKLGSGAYATIPLNTAVNITIPAGSELYLQGNAAGSVTFFGYFN